MRALAILNPKAGQGQAPRVYQMVQSRLESARAWQCAETARRGHARELAARAAADGFDRVIVVGGDGTVSEVAGGLAGTETALGIIPVGTGNDTARNLGIPSDAFAAASFAEAGTARAIDLGEVRTTESTTCFVNIAGFGFDAEVAWRVNHLPKLVGGTVPYVVGVLQTLWRYRSPVVRLRIDGKLLEPRVFMVAVANCSTYGGGMRIVPHAHPQDGVLDACVVSDLPRLQVARLVPRLYSGGHVGHRSVTFLRGAALTADSDASVRCHADGEIVGQLPATFRVLPGALRCVVGESYTTPSS